MQRSFELVEVGNGGWILSTWKISHPDERRGTVPYQSAFPNADDMMKGLAEMLYPVKTAYQASLAKEVGL